MTMKPQGWKRGGGDLPLGKRGQGVLTGRQKEETTETSLSLGFSTCSDSTSKGAM